MHVPGGGAQPKLLPLPPPPPGQTRQSAPPPPPKHKYEVYIDVPGTTSGADKRKRAQGVLETAGPSLNHVVKSHHMKRGGRVFFSSMQQVRAKDTFWLVYAVTLGESTHVVIGQVAHDVPKQVTARRLMAQLSNVRRS